MPHRFSSVRRPSPTTCRRSTFTAYLLSCLGKRGYCEMTVTFERVIRRGSGVLEVGVGHQRLGKPGPAEQTPPLNQITQLYPLHQTSGPRQAFVMPNALR